MTWNPEGPEGNEAAKVKFDIVPYTRGRVLDLGCGGFKAFPHFTGVDNLDAVERFGETFKPDMVGDCAKLDGVPGDSCDAVFSSHLLEHIADPAAALADWWSKIKVGGHLVLYLPHADLYPRMGQDGANPDHKHDFLPGQIEVTMAEIGGYDLLLDEVRGDGDEYSFLQAYRKRADNRLTAPCRNPKPAKTACVVRYGGFGDMIQAANILPELKRQGYHVTMMTIPKGQEILREDPHIDAWIIQDADQVPNHELPQYWAAQAKRFNKFIQLSESVEGTLLAMPGRANHMWPDAVRRREMSKNYLEWTAELAELPYHSEAKFYPSERETQLVGKWLGRFKGEAAGPLKPMQRTPEQFTIVWCLSGSSVHKHYPHQDIVIANLLQAFPDTVIVLTGDEACKILEVGWEDEPRVKCASGELGIRETLTLAQMADLVIGPETGVLNAVAFEPMAKVVFLSHSSRKNLTLHWQNTTALEPALTSCYPCHRLHVDSTHCHLHPETHAALCQQDIRPQYAFEAMARHYHEWKTLREIRRVA